MMVFSDRLKKYREKLKDQDKKWTQKFVADKIGVARVTYTAYENGTKMPPSDTVNRIAELFDVTTDYMMGRTDNPSYNVVDGLKKANKSLKDYDFKFTSEEEKRNTIINRIADEFPNIDLMFDDLSSFSAEELQDVYDYIKFKKSQKEK
ncbi:helix-turn-helix transcriptional regulator [Virgibacillus halodenitrificans]|uniref:Helix-turn-helix transcriptional regulator n=2 Tax=Virgibacillus halodenitrificans TaxID=1482 RepID=A0ABR7VPN2_VIRHA|nr:helix-turn-helix transcriptional regulator [Virgibacillus halodenitrificans]